LPRSAEEPPRGAWIHEIKHDGFRIMARKNKDSVRLFTRKGYNFAQRFPRIVEAIEHLPTKSYFIDGEAIVVDHNGLSVFILLRCRQHDGAAVLCAFDLVELDGNYLIDPLAHRLKPDSDGRYVSVKLVSFSILDTNHCIRKISIFDFTTSG
jgi:ATP-dependent DNA ligase